MRAWLFYWYDVADHLFQIFGIPMASPETDWLNPPTLVNRIDSARDDAGALQNPCPSRWSPTSSERTVVHHQLLYESDDCMMDYDPPAINPDIYSAVCAWLEAQPQPPSLDMGDSFDRTPGGVVMTTAAANTPPAQADDGRIFHLNPLAAVFRPQSMSQSPGSRQSSCTFSYRGTEYSATLYEVDGDHEMQEKPPSLCLEADTIQTTSEEQEGIFHGPRELVDSY